MTVQNLLLAVVGVLLVWTLARSLLGKVAPERAREMVKAGAKLVDVRSKGEHAGGHIAGSLNIPVDQLAARLEELEPKDQPIVVYCASGMRSAGAARLLRARGFSVVVDLGGMSRWGTE